VVEDDGACFDVADHMNCEEVDEEHVVIYERSCSVNIRAPMHILHILSGAWVSIWLSAVGSDLGDCDAASSNCAVQVRTNGRVIVMSVVQVSVYIK
jgi:hypothetical protein